MLTTAPKSFASNSVGLRVGVAKSVATSAGKTVVREGAGSVAADLR